MTFVRGGNVKETIGIGRDAILKEIGGIVLNNRGQIEIWKSTEPWYEAPELIEPLEKEKELVDRDFKNKNVIIGISGGTFTILKNRITYDGPKEGNEKDLIHVLLKLQELFRKNGIDLFHFPHFQRVAARTIGFDLVSVQPMSKPIGSALYLDHQYSGNTSKKIGNGPI